MSWFSRAAAALSGFRSDAAPLRIDATSTTGDATAYSGATVANALSGLGGARDSGASARPNAARLMLDAEELIALYRGGLYRRVCNLLPQWATTKGWRITDDTDDESPLADRLRELDTQNVIREADSLARALGEARILLVTDDDDLTQPLVPEKVKRLIRLEVLDRREFTPIVFNNDVKVAPLGEPIAYQVHPRRRGVGDVPNVHASRLIRFYGDDLPPSVRDENAPRWGADAIGQTMWDAIRNLAQTSAGGARLAQELSVAVFKVNPGAAAGDQREALMSKLRALNLMKSISNAVWLNPEEGFERVAATPSGFADLSEHARLELAMITGYPAPLLFGQAPGGLNSDGDSWKESWFAEVESYQGHRYRRPLDLIARCLYAETGKAPKSWSVEFEPLGKMTALEEAQVRWTHTQADSLAIADGVLRVGESRERYTQAGGFAFELQPVEVLAEEDLSLGPDPAEVEAAAQAMIAEAEAASKAPDDDTEEVPTQDRADALTEAVWIMVPTQAPPVQTGVPMTSRGLPHVTLLYLGKGLTREELAEVVEVVASLDPCSEYLQDGRVVAFPADRGGNGIPVVVEFPAWPAQAIHDALLRRLAHLIRVPLHRSFRPHVTIGYAEELTTEDRAALAALDVSGWRVPVAPLQVMLGSEPVEMDP